MKKRIIWLLMSCVVALSLVVASCAHPAPTTPPTTPTAPTAPTTPTTPTQPTTPAPPATTPQPAPGETLGEILGQAQGIASVKYDMVMTAPGAPVVTQKIEVKGNKMRTEMTQEGQTQIILVDYDARTMYMYMPEENMAMKVAFNPPAKSAVEEAQSVTGYNPTVVGTETIDGKVCLVVEYTAEGAATKMWIWEEHAFPIRVEVTTAEGKTTVEYKNIEFVDIPDSEFELPEDVEIVEVPGM
jgi:outer membrane lipoprotein-sorting protein